jgi:DNA mismatch repair ATPase MutS
MVEYSVGHSFDFIKGMKLLVKIFLTPQSPAPLKKLLGAIEIILQKEEFTIIEKNNKAANLSIAQQLELGHYLKYQFKRNMQELLNCYSQLDAWYGMALAVKEFHLNFPKLIEIDRPFLKAKGLYHLQLNNAIGYDVTLDDQSNFLFLTGANMAGKSTLIKSVGTAVFLAHIGMGVPAENMQLSYFDGMLSNINVMDNLLKGESYFYNEVHRIKSTVQRISDGRKWLILIDELFKGTNVEDAMKCSTTVIKGLLKMKKSLFILSTHLYEIGDELKSFPNIRFNYFETIVKEDQLFFNYQLKEGISNDRLGYLILKNEGVVELLEKL